MERLFDERRCRMERLENDIVYVTVYLNNGYSFAGYLYKDDLEDATLADLISTISKKSANITNAVKQLNNLLSGIKE